MFFRPYRCVIICYYVAHCGTLCVCCCCVGCLFLMIAKPHKVFHIHGSFAFFVTYLCVHCTGSGIIIQWNFIVNSFFVVVAWLRLILFLWVFFSCWLCLFIHFVLKIFSLIKIIFIQIWLYQHTHANYKSFFSVHSDWVKWFKSALGNIHFGHSHQHQWYHSAHRAQKDQNVKRKKLFCCCLVCVCAVVVEAVKKTKGQTPMVYAMYLIMTTAS